MFCQNCGEKLESKNQKFCASCGSAFPHAPDPPQLKVEENQAASTVRSVPVYEPKPIKVGGPGPHSQRCFAFAIVSIALAIAGFIFGGNSFFRFFMSSIFYPYYLGGLGGGLVGIIIAIILNIVGLIFGILSRVNSRKAGEIEPINTLEKFGSVVSVFGIIINIIPLVIIPLIFLVVPFLFMPIIY